MLNLIIGLYRMRITPYFQPKRFGVRMPLLELIFFAWEVVWGKFLIVDMLMKRG